MVARGQNSNPEKTKQPFDQKRDTHNRPAIVPALTVPQAPPTPMHRQFETLPIPVDCQLHNIPQHRYSVVERVGNQSQTKRANIQVVMKERMQHMRVRDANRHTWYKG